MHLTKVLQNISNKNWSNYTSNSKFTIIFWESLSQTIEIDKKRKSVRMSYEDKLYSKPWSHMSKQSDYTK